MVAILCQGGLGNQLFTLNAAHLLSTTYASKVSITFDSPQRRTDRPVEIEDLVNDYFPNLQIKTSHTLFKASDILDRINGRIGLNFDDAFLKSLILDSRRLDAGVVISRKPPKVVRGYFQNSEQVLEFFPNYSEQFNLYLESIKIDIELPKKYQAFHIRRGDYVLHRDSLGELLPEFYLNSREESLPLVISTDDVNFLKEIRDTFPEAILIGPKEASVWQSFKILCQAANLTIANSTFSWWAGVLAESNGSQVIRPKRWNKVETLRSNYLHHPKFIEMESYFA